MERFIDPKTLARVKDMPLVAKTVADGFLHGLHQSRQRGVGIEFSQYRSYEDGDDLGRIDWKLFARSDRYFVREAERESEIAIWFLLDASASMGISSGEEGKPDLWSKLDYAAHLIATLSYIAYRQGDRIGFLALSGDGHHVIPLGGGDQHWTAILLELTRIRAAKAFPSPGKLSAILKPLQVPGLIFVISDFYERENEILEVTKSLSGRHTEVAAVQLVNNGEEDFPYKGIIRFEDAETGEQVRISARDAEAHYRTKRAAFQTELEQKLGQMSVALSTVNVDDPMDQSIADFLKSRERVER